MSTFPTTLDDDSTLPRVDDNITEIGGEAINALRDAVFAIEEELGTGAKGSAASLTARLAISLESSGAIKASALTGLGLVTLPITNSQISATAAIAETKLSLDYSTASLYNYISAFNTNLNTALNFIQSSGSKQEPHLQGITYRHVLSHIDIASSSSNYFKDRDGVNRDNTNLYTLLDALNDDFVSHQKADSTSLTSEPTDVDTGTIPPENFAHVASGIYLNASNFSFIPQTATDIQQALQFIDNSNSLLIGTRIQTLYSTGIPRSSRSPSLTDSDVGASLIPYTLATTFLLEGGSSVPVEDIDTGDDIIYFSPDVEATDGYLFDAKFALVKAGDMITVNYGSVITSFIIKEKKYIPSDLGTSYAVRINGTNLFASTTAYAKINRPLYNIEKQGVLALAVAPLPASLSGAYPSLIVGNPKGAEVVGVGFNPELFDSGHYKLYLQLYPTGNPEDQVVTLAPIDVTGNAGATPGAYTLDSIVNAMNAKFRAPGYNYRFIAFSYKGEIGIMLADPINNASFSIVSGVVGSSGVYDEDLTGIVYTSNVIGLFDYKDGLGFGPTNGNFASPAYSVGYSTSDSSQVPTRIFSPLKTKTYYVDGVERERFKLEESQIIDGYGEGYWEATIVTKTIVAGTRVKVAYQVNQDLTTSGLKKGKTILVQKETTGTVVNFGRFTIEDVQFNDCACDGYTNYATITVYDAVHGTGNTPYLSAAIGTDVRLYFSGDSVGFNAQNASDSSGAGSYKRSFEVYVGSDGETFSHERARMNISGAPITVNGVDLVSDIELTPINIYQVSPKLRGYVYDSLKKITLVITEYVPLTGNFEGYVCNYDGYTESTPGPITTGKRGAPVRFYDETNIDYIDMIFNFTDTLTQTTSSKYIDIQLFATLSLDQEVALLGTCQVNDVTKTITYLRDTRQFGNTSEAQLSTSALDYISAPTTLLSDNGIIRGFDITLIPTGITPYLNTVAVNGGVAVVNGKIVQVNNQTVAIPVVREALPDDFSTIVDTITWFLCVNDKAELELIASTDFDPLVAEYATAGVDHERLFYVKNPNAAIPTAYAIRGTYLADLVLNNKDVTPIAVITTAVTFVTSRYYITSASFTDARRYIANGFGGLDHAFIYGANGSFRTIESLNTWLDQLTNYKSYDSNLTSPVGLTVVVKDEMDISGEDFDWGAIVKFVGDGGTLTASVAASITNVHLENLNISTTVANAITLKGVKNNVTRCYINHVAGDYAMVVAASGSARFTDNIFTGSGVTVFINLAEVTLKTIFIGNVYKTGTTLTAGSNVLPSSLTTLNSSDGA